MNITKKIKIDELKLFYKNDSLTNKPIDELNDTELHDAFLLHVKNNMQEISASDLVNNHTKSEILIETPDGPQLLGDFYIKAPRKIVEVIVAGDIKSKVSCDHLFETTTGWIKSENLDINKDYLITRDGARKLKHIKIHDKDVVYDWEVLHPNHRYYTASGLSSHNTGKTFLALNCCRQAQKKGYHIIYCDSEAAVDAVQFKKFGLDTDKIRYQPINTPLEFKYFVANLLKQLKDSRAAGKGVPKIMLVLDSLGNLATSKERSDALAKSEKKDMTKQQELRSLFRIITMDLAEAKIPFIMTAHTYDCIHGDNEILISDGTYKKIKDIAVNEFVLTLDGPKEVTDKFEYDINNYIELEFEDGYILKCTPNHKLAIKSDINIIFKTVNELEEGDEILID